MKMDRSVVAIARYEKPFESVRKAVDLSHGLDQLSRKARVFIKPNLILWRGVSPAVLPKWGMITTSRVVEDVVSLLRDRGVDEIVIGEGPVISDPKNKEKAARAFDGLGYDTLKRRYGVKCLNIFERPFEKVDLGEGMVLNVNVDILNSDFVINIPVLKTHAQTVVSLGVKNLKGVIDIESRKKCHSVDMEKDLHYMIARLANKLPSSFTVLDGIYTNEGGPFFTGQIRRSNILVASGDLLSADIVGTKILGHDPSEVLHLVYLGKVRRRSVDLSDVEVVGERLEDVASPHEYAFPYNENGTLPLMLEEMGTQGLSYRKYDLTLCTACWGINIVIPIAIAQAWKGKPWDDVEILTGKMMKPTPGKKKTVLIGKCIFEANKNSPEIQEMIAANGCPPSPEAIVKAFHEAGIEVDPVFFEEKDALPKFFMKRYEGRPEFDESFFRID
jgi:uncharacterized protein (DUF362 family)